MTHLLTLLRIGLTALLLALLPTLHAASDDTIKWFTHYDGKSLPAAPWATLGKPVIALQAVGLSLKDDSKDDTGAFEAEWQGDLAGQEIIVEARVKLVSMVGHRDSPTATWPQRDGAPGRLHHKSFSDKDFCEIGFVPSSGKAFVLDTDLKA